MNKAKPSLKPYALQDEPALIERVFPAQKISAEAQKERKAGSGQTLTALGSYWKGRKPLIMARALILGSLLPVTEDLQADLLIFEKLMAIDDESFARREPKFSPKDLAERITLTSPWSYFNFTIQGDELEKDEVEQLSFPIKLKDYPGLRLRWKNQVNQKEKQTFYLQALKDMPYEEKLKWTKRPEECDPDSLYGPIWPQVNAHLASFGIHAYSFEELIEQLGILRFGHRPKVGDAFCGGGSIPFEAARLGCDVYASDLNPVGCMLTWAAFNIIGASKEKRAEIEKAQKEVAFAVDREISELGIEHNSRGDRAKAFLYCLETRCPQTGWMVPLAPNWVISKTRKVCAKLIPNYQKKRFDLEVVTGATKKEMEAAEKGTVQNNQLVYELDGKLYRYNITTIRGNYRDAEGNYRNRLRQWDKHDFKPKADDVFQERLYAIQWITRETLGKSRPETYFASVTEEDLQREKKVEEIVEKNLHKWQEEGLVPDMAIEPGAKTDEPIRTRGWRYWHQMFNARQIFMLKAIKKKGVST